MPTRTTWWPGWRRLPLHPRPCSWSTARSRRPGRWPTGSTPSRRCWRSCPARTNGSASTTTDLEQEARSAARVLFAQEGQRAAEGQTDRGGDQQGRRAARNLGQARDESAHRSRPTGSHHCPRFRVLRPSPSPSPRSRLVGDVGHLRRPGARPATGTHGRAGPGGAKPPRWEGAGGDGVGLSRGFLPPELDEFAYEDCAAADRRGQTISQPYIVALMTEAPSSGHERVLEIGTGSGYAPPCSAASPARSRPRAPRRAGGAPRERLARLGYDNVDVRAGDGTLGWPEASAVRRDRGRGRRPAGPRGAAGPAAPTAAGS